MNHIPDDENENAPEGDLIRFFTEHWGRRQRLMPPEFPEGEIVAGPYPLNVNIFSAGYVPAFPNLDAIVVSPSGERQPSAGGYIRLPPGNYKIYYVDRHEQHKILPEVKAVTLDGATVTITCSIAFTVHDAMAIQNVRNPLDALFKACEAGIRQVIRTHKHDEILDEKPEKDDSAPESTTVNPKIISNSQISEAIKLQANLSEACRAFSLHNVSLIDRQGDLRLLGIREEEAVQVRAGKKEIKQTEIKTEIATRQKRLTEEQGAVIEQQAINEKNRREILFVAEKLSVELDRLRKLPQFSHVENLKAIEARSEALKSLIQAEAMPGFPRNAEDLQNMVEKIIGDMPNTASSPAASSQMDEANELSSTLVQLLIPNKPKKKE